MTYTGRCCHPEVIRGVRADSSEYLGMTVALLQRFRLSRGAAAAFPAGGDFLAEVLSWFSAAAWPVNASAASLLSPDAIWMASTIDSASGLEDGPTANPRNQSKLG